MSNPDGHDGTGMSPADLLDAMRGALGAHHARAVHAKGMLLQGGFKPTAEAHALCAAPVFDGASTRVTVRFSDFGGDPKVADTDPAASPRGMAVKFHLRDGEEMDLVTHAFDGFPVKTADEFGQLMSALAASGPTAPKPTPLDRFLSTRPLAVRFLTTQKGPPVSWATLPYFGVTAFRFVDREGRATHVRYRLVPRAGEQLLDATQLAGKGPDYLCEEIAARVHSGPIVFDWFAQLAGEGDVVDDPSVAWPDDRKLVPLGCIELVRMLFDQAINDRTLVFSPGNVPAGIAPADPMIGARDATYKLSYRARQ